MKLQPILTRDINIASSNQIICDCGSEDFHVAVLAERTSPWVPHTWFMQLVCKACETVITALPGEIYEVPEPYWTREGPW